MMLSEENPVMTTRNFCKLLIVFLFFMNAAVVDHDSVRSRRKLIKQAESAQPSLVES